MIKIALYKLSALLALYLLFYFLFDPVLRWVAVKAGERAVRAKVEIGNLRTGLFPPRLELKGVAVADVNAPMKNLVEFERAAFSMEGRPLLEKKFIVHEASVTGLRLQTDRKSSGAVDLPAVSTTAAPGTALSDKLKSQAGQFSLEKVSEAKTGLKEDYTIKEEDLESPRLAKEIQEKYSKKQDEWQKRWDASDFDGRAARLKEQFDKAQSEQDKMKKVKGLQASLKESKKLSDDLKNFEKDFKEDMAKAKEDLAAVDAARKRDTEKVLSKLKMPSLDADSISRFLLGPELSTKVAKVLDWIAWARAKMPPGKPKPEPPVRGRGITVPFHSERSYPLWAVREMKLTGALPLAGGELGFEGRASGLTSQPALLGEPARLELSGTTAGKKGASLRLAALLDHRQETPMDRIEFSYSGLPVQPMQLGSPDSIQVKVSPGTAALKADFEATGEALKGRLLFDERGVEVDPVLGAKGGGELVRKVTVSAFKGLDRLEAEVAVSGTLKNPSFDVSSNFGKAFSEGLKKALGSELESRRKGAEAKIQAMTGDKVDAAQKTIKDGESKLASKLGEKGGFLKGMDQKVQDAIDKAQKSLLPGGKTPNLKKLFKK